MQRKESRQEDSLYSKQDGKQSSLHVQHSTNICGYTLYYQSKESGGKKIRHYCSFQSSSSSGPQRLSAKAALD